jgi:hypothetical protein
MARRSQQRTRMHACVQAKGKSDQRLKAGDRTVSPVFWHLRQAKVAQESGDWLAGFNAGLRGYAYIYPADVRDRLTWSAGFIEGAAQRLQHHARIRITPRLALQPWWWHP